MVRTMTYIEEDGWTFTRDGITYTVYGSCEGDYSYQFYPGRMYMSNGDPGYPDEDEFVQESFWGDVDMVTIDDDEVDITLTESEESHFMDYLSECLDQVAREYNWPDTDD